MPEKAYKISDAAAMLGIKIRTIRQWIHDGKIKAFRYPNSRNLFVTEAEIKRLVGEREDV